MNFTLHIWRQKNADNKGKFVTYEVDNIDADTSFLEMLDILNEQLIEKNQDCVAFDYDCREGVCGACSLVINGYPHGEKTATTTCQLYMRDYAEQRELWIEPWRAKSFSTVKDLVVERHAFDRIIQAGGYVSVNTGSAIEANTLLIDKHSADKAFAVASCIGCGACVAVCPNASASLFLAAKIEHLNLVPQGRVEGAGRAKKMLEQMEIEGFGSCSNHRHCEKVCPKEIKVESIANMNSLFSLG